MIKKKLGFTPHRRGAGFTLVEMLVVMAVLSIIGTLILTIFTRTLKGSNKAQIIGVIKQNGQSILETMDKTIRNADNLICICPSLECTMNPHIGKATLVVVKDGLYTLFRFIEPQPPGSPTENGRIEWASFNLPDDPPEGTDRDLYVAQFQRVACTLPTLSLTINAVSLTDTSTQTGASVNCVQFDGVPNCGFSEEDAQAGFKKIIKVRFTVSPGIDAPAAIAGQIEPVDFQTTIQLR